MAVQKCQVFLVQGQIEHIVDGIPKLMPEIEQRVVVAENNLMAYGLLEAREPSFRLIGHATLQDYEDAATKLRATLKGDNTGWKLLVGPGCAS